MVDTSQSDNVGAIWSIRWNGPFQAVLKWVRHYLVFFVVLIVEWSAIPGDMNVHIGNIDVIGECADQVESDILTLYEGIWSSRGAAIIEGNHVLIIIALCPCNLG